MLNVLPLGWLKQAKLILGPDSTSQVRHIDNLIQDSLGKVGEDLNDL